MKKLAKVLLVASAIVFAAPGAFAQLSIGISISANIAPPALPVYVQPECPTDGYLWVPGYWAFDPDINDYYWVPGVWVAPPNPGLLWTPAYWGYANGGYGFHAGYWGPHVGFYGGINYGGGYLGIGFAGGAWSGGSFRYNTAVVNVNRTVIHNTYIDRTVIVNNTIVNNNHTSFNGPGGITAKPRPEELAAMKEHHVAPTREQVSHVNTAHADKSQFASANHGKPNNVAMNKVGGTHFTPAGKPAPHKAVVANKPQEHPQAAKPEAAKPEERKAEAPKPEAVKPEARADKPAPVRSTEARPAQQHMQAAHTTATHTTQTKQVHHTAARPKPAPAPKAHPAPKPEEKKHE
jgi:hypothetical protein